MYLVIAVAAVILVVEVAWAYATLYKGRVETTVTTPPSTQAGAKISLVSSQATLKVGQAVTVTTNLSSNTLSDGADVVLSYDPKMLEVVPGGSQAPVGVGSIYSQYPNNSLDVSRGIITASGISSATSGMLANGVFGTIVFRGKAAGSAPVSISFQPGATNDSNIIETATGKDVLDDVQNLQLTITP